MKSSKKYSMIKLCFSNFERPPNELFYHSTTGLFASESESKFDMTFLYTLKKEKGTDKYLCDSGVSRI